MGTLVKFWRWKNLKGLQFLDCCWAHVYQKMRNQITIPYKYRTVKQVKKACENQMKKNLNDNTNARFNVGSFLIRVMKGMQEDWAWYPFR